MKIFDEYVMVAPGSDYGLAMWNDLKKLPNCTFYDYVLRFNNNVINFLHHIHFSFELNKRITIPFQCLWEKGFSLQIKNLDSHKKYCIIFTDISACRVGCGYLKALSKLPNVTLVLVSVNVVFAKKRLLSERFGYFKLMFSFDKSDCKKYNMIYHPTIYSKIHEMRNSEIMSDAFFVGVGKGNRYEKLLKLHSKMMTTGLKADFWISHVKGQNDRLQGLHVNKWLNYKDVLGKLMTTRCVIEIMGSGQKGLTLRAMEAICYNKWLLTDNASVKSLKYYDTGFIHYVESIENTDFSFLLSNKTIDYHYDGDFSPLHLIEHIKEEISKRQI